jgi:hypothetical protein
MVRRGRGVLALAVVGAAVLALPPIAALREARATTDPQALLPNLIADPPDNAALVTSSAEGRTRLLLRFNGYIHNAGPGALDFRASREKPTVTSKDEAELENEIAVYRAREESLPQSLEEALALPSMKLSQRLFTTNEGHPELPKQYVERPHVEEASAGEMFYVNADGHHHWHLQHVARYSLWNASRTAEVAPAQKVGFCLEDSQHVEPGKGPATAVYASVWPTYPRFCGQFEPNATSLYEGISPGWRDVYNRELALQWVDVSDVPPGEYWLREDIDPTGVVKQEGGGAKSEYSRAPTIIPGFDAEAQSDSIKEGEATTVTLGARSYQDAAPPSYAIVAGPQHGTLGALAGGRVTYTPDPGYSGSDSFSFSASEPNSSFPEYPSVASVSIAVQSLRPSVTISGAQAQMTAGTSVQLTATVAHDSGGVEWEATAGALAPEGAGGTDSRYTAPATPPAGATVTVTARLRDDPAVNDQRTIEVRAAPPAEPEPEPPAGEPPASEPPAGAPKGSPPPSGSSAGQSGEAATHAGGVESTSSPASGSGSAPAGASKPRRRTPGVTRPRVMLIGRTLLMTTVPSAAGLVRLTAFLGTRELGTCAAATPAGRTFSCRIKLRQATQLRARIRVKASLRVGKLLLEAVLPAQRIPPMRMTPLRATVTIAGWFCHAFF